MKNSLIISILFIVSSLNAQSYEELIQKADKFYAEKDYQSSADAYSVAFDKKEGGVSDYYNAACSWALTGDTIISVKYLDLAADKGWKNLRHVKKDKDLTVLRDTKKWEAALVKIKANLDEYEKDFDKPLQKKLQAIYMKDQTIRRLIPDAEEKFGFGTEEMNYFFQLMNEQDSINEMVVLEILDERGWVGKSEIGSEANTALWLVIQHAPLETQEKYLPMLKASVTEGESRGRHLALLEDRIQMRNGKPQIYGSQIRRNEETGEQEVYEILDPEYVNQRRKEVGLGPLETYVLRWDIVWDVEQKER